MSPVRPLLRRHQLATALAQDLAGESLVDYSSGMFLAAPRRTGKSTFLNNDCLLYTSPSPRDRQKSRMPSSA